MTAILIESVIAAIAIYEGIVVVNKQRKKRKHPLTHQLLKEINRCIMAPYVSKEMVNRASIVYRQAVREEGSWKASHDAMMGEMYLRIKGPLRNPKLAAQYLLDAYRALCKMKSKAEPFDNYVRKEYVAGLLGVLYFQGEGVPADYEKSLAFFHVAAQVPSLGYEVWLGHLHLLGLGVRQNTSKAIEYYRRSLSYDHQVMAEYLLHAEEEHQDEAQAYRDFCEGFRHLLENTYTMNFDSVYALFKRAAHAGFTPAAYQLGLYYARNYPGTLSEEERVEGARSWLESAAEENYAPALYELGLCYDDCGLFHRPSAKKFRKCMARANQFGYLPAKELITLH